MSRKIFFLSCLFLIGIVMSTAFNDPFLGNILNVNSKSDQFCKSLYVGYSDDKKGQSKSIELGGNGNKDAHTDWISDIIELKDGTIATSSGDKSIKIWNQDTGELIKEIKCERPVYEIMEVHDGHIVARFDDNSAKIWNLAQEKITEENAIPLNFTVKSLYRLKDGRVTSISNESSIVIWNPTTASPVLTLLSHAIKLEDYVKRFNEEIMEIANISDISSLPPDEVNSVIQMDDGRIAASYADDTIKIFNISSGEREKIIHTGGPLIYELRQLLDGRLAGLSHDESRIRFWNLESGQCDHRFEYDYNFAQLANGSLITNIGRYIYSYRTKIKTLDRSPSGLLKLQDDRLAFLDDSSVIIWDPASGYQELLTHSYAKSRKMIHLKNGKLARILWKSVIVWSEVAKDCNVPVNFRYFLDSDGVHRAKIVWKSQMIY